MVSETKVSIKNLYKIFGKNPFGMINHVQNGISKKKLLEKQKAGKKRMRQFGRVEIPQNAFFEALKMGDN